MLDLIPLQLLAPGESAHVGQVLGDREQVHRLEELGLRSGVELEMVQSGSPCIIRLAGAKLCFRECEALSILVQRGVFP